MISTKDFSKLRVLVVGDIMLDKHIYGEVNRISPEAPVPVLKVERESYNPGGAANVADNLISLGVKTYLAGTIGNDDQGRILLDILNKKNIDTSCIIKTSKPTIHKIRGLSHLRSEVHQHLIRIDYEDNSNISEEDENKLLNLIENLISEIDGIILSDYAKGTLTKGLLVKVIDLAKENNKLITADCKPINVGLYKNVDLLKPNKKEAIEMTLTKDLEKAGKILSEKLNSNIVITEGSDGCTLFEKNKNPIKIPAINKRFQDVAGAGDAFLSVLTVALLSTSNFKESVELANIAANIVVNELGVTTITKEKLEKNFTNEIKIVSKEWGEEHWLVNNEKYCGKKMFIKEGYYCSYHKHKIKEETFYILDGEIEIIYKGNYLKVKSGETLHINPGEYHSFRALKDTIFFEFSTQHLDEDNYRLTKSNQGTHEQWKEEIEKATKNE